VDSDYVQSRLKSLERQLNPHFLFNALNSIAELVHQDQNKAEEAILKVSSFLRNSMNEKALISLNEELKNVEDYVDLENIRFSGKIHLHKDIEKRSLYVPKFSIQLIVENAIKHGFRREQELNIFVETKGNMIVVKNDGTPIFKKEFGIGLQNLDQRLALLMHGHLEIADSKETTFIIHLGEKK
jgi:LytS/YehU family sensor histidine kinase